MNDIDKYKPRIKTLLDYNSSRLTSTDIVSGKEFRRMKRSGKILY